MYSVYSLQFPIFHAKLTMIGLWSTLYFASEMVKSVDLAKRRALTFDLHLLRTLMSLNWILILYSIYMIKGVSAKKIFILDNGASEAFTCIVTYVNPEISLAVTRGVTDMYLRLRFGQ